MTNRNEVWKIGKFGWMGYTEDKKIWREIQNKHSSIKKFAEYFNGKGKHFAMQFLLKTEEQKHIFETLHKGEQGSLKL